MKICFFGHSNVDKDLIRNRLNICIGRFIGYEKISFYIGNHGNFDELALSCCLKFKENYNIDIFYFFTSLATKANSGAKKAVNYARKKGKKIINLYKVEDNFLYGLNNEKKWMNGISF